MQKIEDKLNGIIHSHRPSALSVQGQVQQLINDATDVNRLCQMYIWWMPWV